MIQSFDLPETGDLQACSNRNRRMIRPLELFATFGLMGPLGVLGPEHLSREASSHVLNRFCHQSSLIQNVRVRVLRVCGRMEFFGKDPALEFPVCGSKGEDHNHGIICQWGNYAGSWIRRQVSKVGDKQSSWTCTPAYYANQRTDSVSGKRGERDQSWTIQFGETSLINMLKASHEWVI